VTAGRTGWQRTWPAALVAGGSFAVAQFLVSNFWGPYATDIIASLTSMLVVIAFLRVWRPAAQPDGFVSDANSGNPTLARLSAGAALAAWLPWILLSIVMVLWTYFHLLSVGQIPVKVPHLHNGVLISLYGKPYAAVYGFQPLAVGTAVLATTILTALYFRVRPVPFFVSAGKAAAQLRVPGLTVLVIVGLAYLYNYSGMAYTLGAAVAGVGAVFPVLSSYLGWVACFLSGSDTSSNLLFGNLQVAAAHQLHLNPVLLAATNSSGAVTGKMISPQNIAVGVTTVGLVGQEGRVLHNTFWHSVLLAALLGLLAWAQAYVVAQMVP
jgi:lactate permease